MGKVSKETTVETTYEEVGEHYVIKSSRAIAAGLEGGFHVRLKTKEDARDATILSLYDSGAANIKTLKEVIALLQGVIVFMEEEDGGNGYTNQEVVL